MTVEKIRGFTSALPEDCEILVSEIQAIYEAAEKDSFWLICHAYAFGFMRGVQAAKEGKV